MADVRAVKNGNWSDPTVWNTGALPTTADDVFSNNFTVNVDTSFQVLSLRNTSGTGITAGGTFSFNSGSISGSCTSVTGIVQGATNLITVTATTGNVTLNAISTDIRVVVVSSILINYSGNCDLYLTANSIAGGTSVASTNGIALSKTSAGSLYYVGNVVPSNGNNVSLGSTAIFSNNGYVQIIGDVTGGTSFRQNDNIITITAGDLLIQGNVTGATSNNPPAVNFAGRNLTVIGTVIGGTANPPINASATNITISGSLVGTVTNALVVTSAANINITGSITAGSSAAAISSTGAHTFIWDQPIQASAGSPAIVSSNVNATNIFTGPFYNNGSTMAVQCARMFLSSNSTEWQFTSNAIGVSQSLYTADLIPTYPSSSDVRLGTNYGSGSLTGTLAMPQASSVQFGVPVDNTTGSAVLTTASLASAIWDRSRSQLSTTGSIGERLQNVATPTTVGTQISSYLL
jgi:hypothetical protein